MPGRNSFATRTYNVVAGVPLRLPSARQFLLISASVDPTVVGIVIGDGNGDVEPWPFGIAVNIDDDAAVVRISSTVTQTVTLVMTDGTISCLDSRVGPAAGSSLAAQSYGARVDPLSTGIALSAGNFTTSTIFSGVSNVRGAMVHAFGCTMNATIATACELSLRTVSPSTSLLAGRIEAGAILCEQLELKAPVFLDAGVGLEFVNTVSAVNVTIRGSYRIY